jgi:GntR family transcriptional regulator/MocR family aminotransferase
MDFAAILDSSVEAPLQKQLYEQWRGAVLTGRFAPGARVPSTRDLARSLGVSRTTVTHAYEQLIAEGYLEAAHGSGTYVCAALPEEMLRPALPNDGRPASVGGELRFRLSRYGRELRERPGYFRSHPRGTISFTNWLPDLNHFPVALWARLVARAARHADIGSFDYDSRSLGYAPLRREIARYLAVSRAVRCEPDQVIVCNGSQQALDLCARILVDRGDSIAVEDPGYLGARQIFLSHGARLRPIPVDEDGMMTNRLRRMRPKLVYVTPSHQFPAGSSMTLARRLELLEWARGSGAVILEDDYDSEYRFDGKPSPSLQGLSAGAPVIYLGTFSKVLFPGLRLGYMVAPRGLVPVLERAKWVADRQCPILEQAVLASFLADGHLERHIRRMRVIYARRREVLEQALLEEFGDRVRILGAQAGMHLMAEFQTQLSEEDVVRRSLAEGVVVASARPYYLSPVKERRLVLGYAPVGERSLREGVRRLKRALV